VSYTAKECSLMDAQVIKKLWLNYLKLKNSKMVQQKCDYMMLNSLTIEMALVISFVIFLRESIRFILKNILVVLIYLISQLEFTHQNK
jgi:hypothetical protein